MEEVNTHIGDLLADGLDSLESLSADGAHLLSNLAVLLLLLALLLLFLGEFLLRDLLIFDDVSDESDLADLVAVVINNVAVVVNLEADAVAEVTSSESAHDIAVLVANFTLLVDTAARHGVDLSLLLFRLPSLGLTDKVTVLVLNFTVLVDLVSDKLLDIAFDDAANDATIGGNNVSLLVDGDAVETSERSLRLGVGTLGEFGLANDISGIVPDLTLAINLLADHSRRVTFGDTTNDSTGRVDDVASLVDSAASKSREVLGGLLLFLPRLSMTLGVSVLVGNVTILVDGKAYETLDVTFGNDTDAVALGVLNVALLVDVETFKSSEGTFGSGNAFVLRKNLATANNLTSIAVDLALFVAAATSKLLDVTFDKLTKRNTVFVDDESLLVQLLAIKDGVVKSGGLFLFVRLGMALCIAVLVVDVTILVNLEADKLLHITFGDLSDNVVLGINNETFLVDTKTLMAREGSLGSGDTLVLRENLAVSNNLSGIVVDIAVLVALTASKLLDVALKELTDGNAIVVNNKAVLVELLAVEHGVVDGTFLFLLCERFGMALDVTISIHDVAVLIDSETNQALGVALSDLTNDVLVLVSDLAVSDDAETLKTSKRTVRLGLTLVFGDQFDAANDLACIVPDLTLIIDLLASELLGLALNKTGDRYTLVTNDEAGLVQDLTVEAGKVDGILFRLGLLVSLLVTFGVTNNGTLLVENVTILIDSTTDELLGIALGELTNAVAVLVLDPTVLDNDQAIETSERRLLIFLNRNSLGATNNMALVVPELTLVVCLDSGLRELLGITFGEFTDDGTVGVDDLSGLVDLQTFEDRERREVGGCVFSSILSTLFGIFGTLLGILSAFLSVLGTLFGVLCIFDGIFCGVLSIFGLVGSLLGLFELLLRDLLRQSLDTTNGVAVVVEDLALVVDLLASAFAELARGEFADLLAILVEDLALLVDLEAFEDVEVGDLELRTLGLFFVVGLVLILTLLFLFRNVLAKLGLKFLGGLLGSLARGDGDLANDLAILVKNLTLVVDLLAGTLLGVALSKFTDLFTFIVKNLALLVDLSAIKNAKVKRRKRTTELLGSTLSKTDLAENVVVSVDDFALFVDLEVFGLEFARLELLLERLVVDLAKDLALVIDNLTSVVEFSALKSLDARELILNVLSGILDIISSVFDVVGSLVDLVSGVGVVSSSILGIVSSLLNLLLDVFGCFRVNVGMANDIAILVNELAVLVESSVHELLRVAVGNLADSVTILVEDVASGVAGKALEDAEVGLVGVVVLISLLVFREVNKLLGALWEFTLALEVGHLLLDLFGKKLAASDKITIVVKNLAVITDWVTSKILSVTLSELADGVAVLIVDHTVFGDLEALEHREVYREVVDIVDLGNIGIGSVLS
jgi:hypothetical protein